MSRSTFRVLFYLKRNAPKKNGLVPVMCRITVNGKISQFSCKLDVEEKLWSVSLGRMSGRSIVAQEANRMLDKIRVGINKAYQEIMDRDGYVSAEKVRNAFLGMGQNHKTLLAVFRQHNEDYAKQVGKMKSQRSYWKYCTVYKHLEEFIKHRYKVSDIALRELSPAFITDFELFLRTEKNHCTNTVWSYMMPFRSIIYTAINNGWLQRDPFYTYRITKEETKRRFLTKEEITMLINGTFKKKSYEQIRDLFIFCCFSGLSWRDMYNLTTDHLQTSFDGHLWIKTNRQMENPGYLYYENGGSFIPGTLQKALATKGPQRHFRNECLCRAMVNFNMIDTVSRGIKKMFNEQWRRHFPMPDYEIDATNKEVGVKIYGNSINEKYTKLLKENDTLTLEDCILLDAVQKGHRISADNVVALLERGLLEGDVSEYHISLDVAKKTRQLPEYTRNKGLDKSKIQQMILQYLQNAGSTGAKRDAIFDYLKEVLPQNKTHEQQERMLGNILSEMKENGLIVPEGRTWFLKS